LTLLLILTILHLLGYLQNRDAPLCQTLPKTVICRTDREINAVKYDNEQKYADSIEQYQTTVTKIEEYRKELEKA
jgi:hypothetical protein